MPPAIRIPSGKAFIDIAAAGLHRPRIGVNAYKRLTRWVASENSQRDRPIAAPRIGEGSGFIFRQMFQQLVAFDGGLGGIDLAALLGNGNLVLDQSV